MKTIDKYLRDVRIRKAKKFIKPNDSVLDIGSADGIMFEKWRGLIKAGTGIDPILSAKVETDLYILIPGYFPDACPPGSKYDVITMLAVLEHIPADEQKKLGDRCFDRLEKGGRIIITVPSPQVDLILGVLVKLKLIDGMSLEEHYGFKPEHTTQIFPGKYFKLISQKKFQLGLNNLFVFEKIGE